MLEIRFLVIYFTSFTLLVDLQCNEGRVRHLFYLFSKESFRFEDPLSSAYCYTVLPTHRLPLGCLGAVEIPHIGKCLTSLVEQDHGTKILSRGTEIPNGELDSYKRTMNASEIPHR